MGRLAELILSPGHVEPAQVEPGDVEPGQVGHGREEYGRAAAGGVLVGDGLSVAFARAAASPESARAAAAYAGANVVIAVADQLRAALALIALDGVAARIVLVPAGEAAAHLAAIVRAADAAHVIKDWMLPGEDDAARPPPIAPAGRETEWVLLTSGTTGVPKLVVHTLQTLAGYVAAQSKPDWTHNRVPQIWGTFYDTRRYGGLQVLLRALIQGQTLVLPDPTMTLPAFVAHAAAHGLTHLVGTPSHYRQLLMSGLAGRLTPRYVRLSGEIADQAILNRLRHCYPQAEIVHAFASTEAGLAFQVSDGRAGLPADYATVLVPRVEAEIRGQDLRVRSPLNALGYLDRTRIPVAAEDGFVETGDLLTLQDGRYYFAGRRSGQVNIGGRKVHPEEVEAILYEHPAVDICAVWARRNPITGAVVAADILCRPDVQREIDSRERLACDLVEDIQSFCRTRMQAHKIPVSISFVRSLDLSRSGKLARLHA